MEKLDFYKGFRKHTRKQREIEVSLLGRKRILPFVGGIKKLEL
jgi:hypothetical protein